MIKVSNNFKNNIYAPERTTKGRVSFEILDVEAYEDVSISVSGEAPISQYEQTTNKVREMSNKYATFERDYFLLDGSFYLPPENELESELGWWSEQISGADGLFSVSPVIEFTFTEPHNSMGLTLTFDTQANEFPSDFLIEVFNSEGVATVTQSVTNHNSPVYFLETPLDNYQRITITFLKTAIPERRIRLVEIDFGVVRDYSGEKLISLKVVEEMDLLTSTVPSNEMTFVLDNSDNAFNILNPNGIYRFLKPNQEMSAEIGLKVGPNQYEYVSLGKYYLNEWTVEEGAMTSSFVGRDIFTRLEVVEYTNLLQNTNLYDLAVDVLTQANVENYEIDEALREIPTIGFVEKIKVRDALQLIAIAGRSVIRQNRNGAIVLEQFEELTFETGYVTFAGLDTFLPVYPQVYIDYSVQAIDFETAFEVPKVTLATAVSKLVFKVFDGVETTDVTILNPLVKDGIGYEINNPLINTPEQAELVAEWSFREYNLIAEYQATWRQNPALECGDIILIEDNFGAKKKSRITKQEISFSGYLDGLTEAKGGI